MDLDRLERLQKLRESGAITEEEYQSQKSAILAGGTASEVEDTGKSPVGLIASIVIAVLLILGIGYFFYHQHPTGDVGNSGNEAAVNEMAGDDNSASAESVSAAATQVAPADLFAWAVDDARIDQNPAFIEAKLGPAERKSGGIMTFHVNGCRVDYSYAKGVVQSVTGEISDKCHMPFGNSVLDGRSTVAQFADDNGVFRTPCLGGSCGNAAEPQVEYYIPGNHAGNYLEYSFVLQDQAYQDDPNDTWLAQLAASKGVAPDDLETTCADNPPAPVQQALMKSKIRELTIGRNLPFGGGGWECDKS